MTATAGHELTATLRRYFSIGPRTRRYRDRADLHASMVEALYLAAQYPGYYCQPTQDHLHAGYGAALSYSKHITGYRASPVLITHIQQLPPWYFAGLLGNMVDAGVTCTGDGERFFADMARKQATAGQEQQR